MQTLITQLNWRYAVKQYDRTKALDPEKLNLLKDAVRLAPSSFGLQPYKLIFVEDPATREALKQASFNQPQITDAACLVVFAIENNIDEPFVDEYFKNLTITRNQPLEGGIKKHRDSIVNAISKKATGEKRTWATHQTYLALGFFLYTAAQLGIDANPMEGFMADAYDKILKLDELGLSAVVIAAVGHRHPEDHFQRFPKVRRPHNELFIQR